MGELATESTYGRRLEAFVSRWKRNPAYLEEKVRRAGQSREDREQRAAARQEDEHKQAQIRTDARNRSRTAKARRRGYLANMQCQHGIDESQIAWLFHESAGKCQLCHKVFGPTDAIIDHCHRSGRVRGLICHACNALLGFARDDPETLNAAIQYLANPLDAFGEDAPKEG